MMTYLGVFDWEGKGGADKAEHDEDLHGLVWWCRGGKLKIFRS